MWGDLFQTHGYWALALGCLLEGETLLLMAGFAAHRGWMDPVAVFVIAAAAGFTGDQFWYWLGRRHGAAMLRRWPALARQAPRLERGLQRWPAALIIGVRFAYGLRIAGPLLMGMSTMAAWRFAALNALGAMLWAGAVGAAGWLFGLTAERLLGRLQHLEGWLLLVLLLAGASAWLVQRRRGRSV
jgi:membrane protein DedA with SNARE-associated domain